MRAVLLPGLPVLLMVAACSIPASDFRASPDAVPGGDDQPSHVLAIVPSATAVELDEDQTKDLTVRLSQPPGAPLTVTVETTATTKLGISVPTLTFTPSNFDQPQVVPLIGLHDVDTADDHADLTLSGPGVDPVTVAATVHDVDHVAIAVSGTSPIVLQEGSSTTVNVHLTAQPTGDVIVTAVLGTGPVTVAPAMRVFTATNYDADQAFTFSAPHDADSTVQEQALTFRASNLPDKILTIQDLDIDVQGILVDVHPANQIIGEGTSSSTLAVSLSQRPLSNVMVTITTTTGAVQVAPATLTFTPDSYATKQNVTLTGLDDPDTADGMDTIKLHATDPDHGGAALDRSVQITVHDDDTQRISTNAPSPLVVSETTSVTFDATLDFKPSANVVVAVVSQDSAVANASPGTLTFTPADYNQPHTVTVRGVRDGNLATSPTTIRLSQAAIGNTDVAVNVTDVDRQVIVLSTTALAIPEGSSRTFDVSLMFDPGGPVTVNLANDNQAVLPIDKTTIGFSSANYQTPVHVTVSPMVDSNASSESATITVSGATAPTPVTLTATTTDSTVVQNWGWPTPFPSAISVPAGTVVAYKVDVGAVATIDTFHTYVPTATGAFRMALYTNASEQPGTLVAEMSDGKVLTNGVNDAPILGGPVLGDSTYFLVIRFSQDVNVGYAAVGTVGRQCIRNFGIPMISTAWPSPFGAAACTQDRLINMWITTHHQ